MVLPAKKVVAYAAQKTQKTRDVLQYCAELY